MSDEKKNIPGAAPLDDSVPAETPSLLQRDLGLDRRGTTPATPGPFQGKPPLGGPEFAPTVISPKRDTAVAPPPSSAPVPVPATSPFAKTVASATNPVLAKMQAAERDYAQRLAAEQKLADRVSAERKATERLVADRSRPPVATPGLASTAVVPPSAAQALRASLGSRPLSAPVSPAEMVTDPITSARVAAALAAPPRAPSPAVKTDPLQTPDVAGAMARAPAQPPGLSPRVPTGEGQPDPTRLMRPPAPQPITSPMPGVARGLSPEPHAEATNVIRGPGVSPAPHADATNVVRGPGLSPHPHADATRVMRGPGLSPQPHAERTNAMWGPPDPDRVPTAPVGQPATPAPQRPSSVAIPPPPARSSSVAIPPPAPIGSSVAIPPPPPRTSAVPAPWEQTTPGSPLRGLVPQAPAKAPVSAGPVAAPQSPAAARPAIAPPGLVSRPPVATQNPASAPLRPPLAAQSPTPVPATAARPPLAAPLPPSAARPPAPQVHDTAIRPAPLAPPAAPPRAAPAHPVAATPRALGVPTLGAPPGQLEAPGVPLPTALLRHGPGATTEDDDERVPTRPNNEQLQVTAAKPAAIRGNAVQVTVTPASPVSQREVAPPAATPPRPAPPRATAEFIPQQPVTMPDRRPVSYEDLPPAMEKPKPLGPEFFRTQPGVGGPSLKGLTGVGPVPTAGDDTTGPRPAHGPRDTAEQDKGGTVPQLEAVTGDEAEARAVASDQVLASVAPVWRRAASWVLDLAIIAALAGGAIAVLVPLLGGKPPPPALHGIAALLFRLKPLVIPAAVAVLGLAFLYTTLFAFLLEGRTPGRLLFGIRLVDSSGHAPGVGRAFLRAIFALISFALFLSGFWLALFDRRGQTLHDKLTRTFVIRPV